VKKVDPKVDTFKKVQNGKIGNVAGSVDWDSGTIINLITDCFYRYTYEL
jgi:hypothetical protein